MSSKNGLKIHQPHKLETKIKALTKSDVSFKSAACVCVALFCAAVLATAPIAYTAGTKSAATKEVAQSMAADNKDYAKLIKKYNSLVDEYNGVADDYNDAKDAIAEADNVKAGIKDLNSQHDELQKKVDAKKAELQSLTGQVDQAKRIPSPTACGRSARTSTPAHTAPQARWEATAIGRSPPITATTSSRTTSLVAVIRK